MIRNIVFDLGNVLLSWKPGDFLIRSGYNEESARLILKTVYRSPAWFSLDNGDITREEAIGLMAENSSFNKDEIEALLDLCIEIILPVRRNTDLLPELKKQGFRLYYLSNFPLDLFRDIRNRNGFFSFFDGGIISAEVRYSKPDPEIYRILFRKYNIDPLECLYIDDIEVNVQTAGNLGMKAIHLKDPGLLKEILQEEGIRF